MPITRSIPLLCTSKIRSIVCGEPPPPVSELAEGIKALLAGHTVEATPQRAGKRCSSAEEPVTARIRRKEANRDPRADVTDQPVLPGESPGAVTIGRRSYRRYGTA